MAFQYIVLFVLCACVLIIMSSQNIGVKEGLGLSSSLILSSFAFAYACSYLTVIGECRDIRSFLVRKCLDFPELEQVVPSSMADAVRKEICNTSKEETAHMSVHCLACLAWQSLKL